MMSPHLIVFYGCLLLIQHFLFAAGTIVYSKNGIFIEQLNMMERDLIEPLELSNKTISSLQPKDYIAKIKTKIIYNETIGDFQYGVNPIQQYYKYREVMFTRTHDFLQYNETAMGIAPDGIVATADWMIMYHSNAKCHIYGATLQPQVIVTVEHAYHCFVDTILPRLKIPFVLISISNDHTLPINFDKRIGFDSNEFIKNIWTPLIMNPMVLHLFVENLSVKHFKASSIPIGSWYHVPYNETLQSSPTFSKREHKLFASDKIHDGHAQFQDRITVAKSCIHQLQDICVHFGTSLNKDMRHEAETNVWAKHVAMYQFHLCTHGGGHDTSTKSWETMLLGSIPVIERNALDDSYGYLPVAFVANITDFVLNHPNKNIVMKQWERELGPFYENPLSPDSLYQKFTLPRLKIQFWQMRIVSHIPDYQYGYLGRGSY